jgi:penicillin-binding protein 1C
VLHERRVDPEGRRLAWTPLREVSPLLVTTLIETEDQRFRAHGGVDWYAIGAALRDGVRRGRVRGASTLTMQLAALLDPSLRARRSGRGGLAKLRQLRAARALEATWSKDQILEAHLNLASFRGELQGVAAAARGRFDREPHGLGETESALLVALLRAPNAQPGAVATRACRIAARRTSTASCDAIAARSERVLATPPVVRPRATLAPHLAARLLRDTVPARVATTLDASLQRIVAEVLPLHPGAERYYADTSAAC